MKAIILSVLCFIIVLGTSAQEQRGTLVNELEVISPSFVGNNYAAAILNGATESIYTYLSENIEYPYESARYHTQGTAVVQFVITTNGGVSNFEIVNSVSKEIDKEVIRVLKSTEGMWKPGMNNGQAVEMSKVVSIAFAIGETAELAKNKSFAPLAKRHFKKAGTKLLVKNNPKQAERQYDKVVVYFPNDKGTLLMRGLCRYELGDIEGAKADWQKVVSLGGIDFGKTYLGYKINDLKGYHELSSLLK